MKKNLLLLFSVVLITFFLSEIFVRIFFPQSLQRYWVVNEEEYGLIVNKKNFFYKLHRLKNIKASYLFGDYRNRITLRDENLKYLPKVLILGDSFTFGWLLEDKLTFVHKLQLDNMNYEFINPSVGAWGSSAYTMYTELYCKKIKPEKIIVFLNTDDIYRGYHNRYYKLVSGKLIKNRISFNDTNKLSKFDENIPFYLFLKKNSHSFLLIRNIVYNFFKSTPKLNEKISYYYPHPHFNVEKEKILKINLLNQKIFQKLKKITKTCGAELLIIYTGWANLDGMSENNPNKFFLLNAKNFFNSNNILYHDLSYNMIDLYANPNKYLINVDFHHNEKGANLIYLSARKFVNEFLKKK